LHGLRHLTANVFFLMLMADSPQLFCSCIGNYKNQVFVTV
jgi:hypothetical protein